MTRQMRCFAKYLLCVGLYYSGLLLLARFARSLRGRRRVVILNYHSFSDDICYLNMAISPCLFMEQVRYLRKQFRVLTLSKVLERSGASGGMRGDVAVVTVDDGYADNFGPLVEAARMHGVPSTVYLTTNCIDTGQPTTAAWIMLAIHHAAVESMHLPELGVERTWIRTPAEKDLAIRKIDAVLRPLSEGQRDECIQRVLERSGAEATVRGRARSMMLDWQQVRQMHAAGIEIGAHSLTHPVLTRLHPSAARDEICGSILRVREMVGVETVTFAYPYGGVADVSEAVVEACRASGAAAAVVGSHCDSPGGDSFRIPRMMVTSDMSTTPWGTFSRAVWACELEGTLDVVRRVIDRATQWRYTLHQLVVANELLEPWCI